MPSSNLLLASKIVVTEEPPQIRNIPGAPTAIIAMSGVTQRGPVGTPIFVTTWEEFVEIFGGYLAASDLPLAVEAAFRNGATAIWVSRVVHYTDITDASTLTAAKGSLTILDRGGAASPAILDSEEGPFDLENGEVLEINIDGGGADTLTIAAAGAHVTAGAGTYDLSGNNKTIVYQTKLPGSNTLSEQKTITFVDADFATPAAATATEVALAISARGYGVKGVLNAGNVRMITAKQGTAASLVLVSGTALAVLGGTFSAGTTAGTGNVADVTAVTATELAALLTALTISAGTATAVGDVLRLASTATGAGADVVITANTTALGIFAGALPITEVGSAAGTSDALTVEGKDPGTYVDALSILIEAPSSGAADEFNLRVKRGTATLETWTNLNMDPDSARYVETVVNAGSLYIQVTDEESAATEPANRPAVGTYTGWAGADDGLTSLADSDYTGSEAGGTGLYAFDVVDNLTILAVPGRSTSAVHNAMVTYCEVHRVGLAFAVLDPPSGMDEQEIVEYVKTTAALKGLTEYAAIYWPRVKILNPSTSVFGSDELLTVPPSGAIVGVYARTDASRPSGVFQPPAGVENGRLFGVLGFETDDVLDERKRDVVFPELINPLCTIDGSPRHIDGSRTLKDNGNFPTVAERRGVIFVEKSLKTGLLFAKHRNNDRRLRMEVKRSIQAFLLIQHGNQAFRGDTPAESFFVDVSDALNPAEVVFAGRMVARIGLATQKPAEYIVLKFTQDTRELEESLADAGLN